MAEGFILRASRYGVTGRALDFLSGLAGVGRCAGRWQRVRRKRLLADLREGCHSARIAEVRRSEAGRGFSEALELWLVARRDAAVPAGPDAIAREGHGPVAECSVVINTVDRAADLAITLAELAPVWNPLRYELIVVLGPTADDSARVIGESPVPCRRIDCNEKNLAVSRNLGLQAAGGRIVAFLDDDASPDPGWLDALEAALDANPRAAVASGFALDRTGGRFLNRYVVADALGRSRWFDEPAEAEDEILRLGADRAFLTATGCNMAFRSEQLREIGGFDPFYRYFLEETDAVRRLMLAGYDCLAVPESGVRHRLGGNIARGRPPDSDQRLVIIRSQLHYIDKFGRGLFPPAEIASCVWERVLRDLEKIAWDETASARAAVAQREYLGDLTGHLRRIAAAGPASAD